MAHQPDDRFTRAMEPLRTLFPPDAVSPPQFRYPPEIERDWSVFSISTVLGDVWSRPGLEMKHRSMISIAALTALDKPAQLKAYIIGALNVGLTRSEVCEVIFQMAVYAGFPAAILGFAVANEVFADIDRASGPA